VRAVDRGLTFLAIALSEQVLAAERAGLKVVSEIFADRGYADTGRLLPRGTAGAFIDAPEEAAERSRRMVEEEAIITASGRRLPTPVGSICVHSDGARAVETARAVRDRLAAANIEVVAFS
jgi:UPF0271 protein